METATNILVIPATPNWCHPRLVFACVIRPWHIVHVITKFFKIQACAHVRERMNHPPDARPHILCARSLNCTSAEQAGGTYLFFWWDRAKLFFYSRRPAAIIPPVVPEALCEFLLCVHPYRGFFTGNLQERKTYTVALTWIYREVGCNLFITINRQPIFCHYTRIPSPFTYILMDIRTELGCKEQLAGQNKSSIVYCSSSGKTKGHNYALGQTCNYYQLFEQAEFLCKPITSNQHEFLFR